jgi:hypothetical protein
MSDYNYENAGKFATIKSGAHLELYKRNWHKGVESNHEGETGRVLFEFGEGTNSHHISVEFDNEAVGFPLEFVSIRN